MFKTSHIDFDIGTPALTFDAHTGQEIRTRFIRFGLVLNKNISYWSVNIPIGH